MIAAGDEVLICGGHPWSSFAGDVVTVPASGDRPRLYGVRLRPSGFLVAAEPRELVVAPPAPSPSSSGPVSPPRTHRSA